MVAVASRYCCYGVHIGIPGVSKTESMLISFDNSLKLFQNKINQKLLTKFKDL